MTSKADTDNFLRKELQLYAVSIGETVIPEQANFSEASANRVVVSEKRVR